MKSAAKPLFVVREQTQVGAASGVVVASEARRHPRIKVALSASVTTLDAERDGATGASFFVVSPAETLDVGDGGMALQLESGISSGRRVVVELQLDGGESFARSARVAWTSRD